jgi:hypothetical protein
MTLPFTPWRSRDDYREALHRLIEAKVGAGSTASLAPP